MYDYTISQKIEKVNIFPYHISEQPKEMQRINLLLISEEEDDGDNEGIIDENYGPCAEYSTGLQKEIKYHYCWIKNLNRLLYDQNKYKCKTYYSDHCLHRFTKEDLLIKHKEDCYGLNQTSTRIEMPTKGRSHITFKNNQNKMPIPYAIYADFESIIKPKTAKAGDKTEITSEHDACGFGY